MSFVLVEGMIQADGGVSFLLVHTASSVCPDHLSIGSATTTDPSTLPAPSTCFKSASSPGAGVYLVINVMRRSTRIVDPVDPNPSILLASVLVLVLVLVLALALAFLVTCYLLLGWNEAAT
eukprot:669251_1